MIKFIIVIINDLIFGIFGGDEVVCIIIVVEGNVLIGIIVVSFLV